jgi:hypothetical protein
MRGRRGILTGAVAAVTALGVAVPALAGQTATTAIVAFSWTDADGDTDYFDGRISSSEDRCEKDRKVVVYRKQSGRDARIGGAATDGGGKFRVEREDPGSGRFYLKAKRKEAGPITCKKAQTGQLQVTDLDGV